MSRLENNTDGTNGQQLNDRLLANLPDAVNGAPAAQLKMLQEVEDIARRPENLNTLAKFIVSKNSPTEGLVWEHKADGQTTNNLTHIEFSEGGNLFDIDLTQRDGVKLNGLDEKQLKDKMADRSPVQTKSPYDVPLDNGAAVKYLRDADENAHSTVSIIAKSKDPDMQKHIEQSIESGAHLSHEEFAERFGAAPTAIAAIEKFAKDNGLSVVERNNEARSFLLDGPIGRLNEAFGTKIKVYELQDGSQITYGELKSPPALASEIVSVAGVDDRPHASRGFETIAGQIVDQLKPSSSDKDVTEARAELAKALDTSSDPKALAYATGRHMSQKIAVALDSVQSPSQAKDVEDLMRVVSQFYEDDTPWGVDVIRQANLIEQKGKGADLELGIPVGRFANDWGFHYLDPKIQLDASNPKPQNEIGVDLVFSEKQPHTASWLDDSDNRPDSWFAMPYEELTKKHLSNDPN